MILANPFSPGKRMTRPALFMGRQLQLDNVVPIMYQAAANNARHVLVTGERGIGKSSFSSQIQGIARGEQEFLELVSLDSASSPLRMLVVEHITQDGQSPGDIAAGILNELESAKGLQRFLNFNLDFTVELGPLSTNVSRRDAANQDVVTVFVDQLQSIASRISGKLNGILIVVDEIDRVAEAPGISSFFKVVTEKLSSRGVENVAFMLVGILGTLEALSVEHPSVSRVFKPVEVPLMSEDEAREFFVKALDGTGVSITEEALSYLAHMSDGYPNSLHLLGEQAYELSVDSSYSITLDVAGSAVEELIRSTAKEDLDRRYLNISRGRARTILRFMANSDDEEVRSSDVVAHLKKSNSDVSQYFDTLLRADVLVRPRPGIYRFRERIFREYVRQIEQSGIEPEQRRPVRRSKSGS